MKIAVIGAGNMGSAIVRGIWANKGDFQICVSNPSMEKLFVLSADCPGIETFTDNCAAVTDADVVIIAVKPWIFHRVAEEISSHIKPGAIVVSIVAGIQIYEIEEYICNDSFEDELPVARVIPDTAISVGAGMSFISTYKCDEHKREVVKKIFDTMGATQFVDEQLMPAVTALSSCGIAYVYKFVQAYVQAGVEMGIYPKNALNATLATIEGAVKMLRQPGATVQGEIDRVTTPGGMTIKGINELEHEGFVSSVIKAIKRPLQK